MKPFLPELPVGCTDEQLEAAYAQGLLRKTDLQHGAYYRGVCRGGEVARWHAGGQKFLQYQIDCGFRLLRAIPHPQDERQWDAFMAVEATDPEDAQRVDDADFAPYFDKPAEDR
jgi:hypothetical protein